MKFIKNSLFCTPKGILWAFLPLFLQPLFGEEPPELSSDKDIEYDQRTNTVIAQGHARLFYEPLFIEADQISLNRDTMLGAACQNVQLTSKDTRFLGDYISFNYKDKTLESEAFRLGQPPFYLTGECASGPICDLEINKAFLYFGEPDPFVLNVYSQNVEVLGDPESSAFQKVITKNVVFRIGKVPFFYLPYFSYSLEEFPIDWESDIGEAKRYGYYLRNTILVATNQSFKWGGLLDYYQKRSILAGPAVIYNAHTESTDIVGVMESGLIHDNGNKTELGVDSLGRPVPPNRRFVEWRHKQDFYDRLYTTAHVRYWSDSEVLRDFRPVLFGQDQDPDNFAEVQYTGNNYFLSAFSRFRPNNFQVVQERIPEINFDMVNSRILCTPIYHRLNATYVHLGEKEFNENPADFEVDRFNIFYGLNYPINLSNAITLTPVAGGRVTYYAHNSFNSDETTRLYGQLGFDLQLNAYGEWFCKNCLWKIDGIRHILRPTIQYRYILTEQFGPDLLRKIDKSVFTTNIRPLDLGYIKTYDEGQKYHTLRFGLENTLQTRQIGGYGSRDLAYLNFFQDYNIALHPGAPCHWGDLFTEFGVMPAYWINFNLISRFKVDNFTFEELRTRLVLKNARFWTLSFTTDSIPHITNQYYLNFLWNMTPRTGMEGYWRYDAKLDEITAQSYILRTRLGKNWGVDYMVTHRRGSVRENEWEFGIKFTLIPLNQELLPLKF